MKFRATSCFVSSVFGVVNKWDIFEPDSDDGMKIAKLLVEQGYAEIVKNDDWEPFINPAGYNSRTRKS